jgi:N-carbamoylputrescine amidase
VSKPSIVHLGLIQTYATAQPAENLERQLALIEQAAARGANIICTQELFRSPYFCQEEDHENFKLAEPIPAGPSTQALLAKAKALGVVIIGSLFERRAAGLYHNTAVIIDATGELLGIYRKMHIPDDPHFYEKFYFTPGDLGFRAWDTAFGRIGVLICWDQWYPEAARLTALRGAQILFYPTAIGWHPAEKPHYGTAHHHAWQTSQQAHAVANGCYVAAINRVGFENPYSKSGIEFWGQSFVADCYGQIIQRASAEQEEILIVPVDLAKVEETRTHWPFLRDRRVDVYRELEQRYLD